MPYQFSLFNHDDELTSHILDEVKDLFLIINMISYSFKHQYNSRSFNFEPLKLMFVKEEPIITRLFCCFLYMTLELL